MNRHIKTKTITITQHTCIHCSMFVSLEEKNQDFCSHCGNGKIIGSLKFKRRRPNAS